MTNARKAEIVGGGIAGLFCGWALASRGWTVRVHERSPAIRDVGAGIYLMRNSVSIFEHHGIADYILRDAVVLTGSERSDRNGRIIQQRTFSAGSPWYVLPRYTLVQRLADVAAKAGVEVVTGSNVAGITPDGKVTEADGSVVEADLVVAADGFRSRLREKLDLTGTLKERSSGAIRILVPRRGDPALFREYWSGHRRIGIAPCTNDLTYAYLSSPNADPAARIPLDIAVWKSAFPGLTSFLDRVEDPSVAVRHAYPHARATSWSKGRAAIIGDAAHALPPTLAQGAGLSMANGYALAKTLDEQRDVEAGLKLWEERYRWISDRTQDWSLRLDAITTKWPNSLSYVRRAAIWAIGATLNSRVRVADSVRLVP